MVRFVLFLAALIGGQSAPVGLRIGGETTVDSYRIVRLKAEGHDAKAGILWRVKPLEQVNENKVDWGSKRNAKNLEFVAPPGRYAVELISGKQAVGGEFELDAAEVVVTIKGSTPAPNPDPPTPPNPDIPFPLTGFRVLIIYQDSEARNYPPGQFAAIFGQEIRTYLNRKCAVGKDGATREWRIYDPNQDISDAPKHFRDAMARPRTILPWIVVSNGVVASEGPLPLNIADTLALLKKFGGE